MTGVSCNFTEILLACQRPNPAERKTAEEQLKNALANHTSQYFQLLVEELADESKPVESRQLAGLQLKNALYGKSRTTNKLAHERWLRQTDGEIKKFVRQKLVEALSSRAPVARQTAALVFGKLSAIELPHNEWPQLVELLLNRVTNPEALNAQSGDAGVASAHAQALAAILALGYISEEMSILSDEGVFELSVDEVNRILAGLVQGMLNQNDLNIKNEATKALYFAVVLAENSMLNEPQQRDGLMGIVLEACGDSTNVENQKNALEVLTKCIERYYSVMVPYIERIARVTFELITCGIEGVDMRAMVVWTTICEEELSIIADAASGRKCHNFGKDCYNILIPKLTQMLIDPKQEEDYDSEEYSVKMAAQVSLTFAAQILGNLVVDPVMEFIKQHSTSPDWRKKEAAILALGSIMQGPRSSGSSTNTSSTYYGGSSSSTSLVGGGGRFGNILGNGVGQLSTNLDVMLSGCWDFLLENLRDRVVAVRDTTAWTIASILKYHIGACDVGKLTQTLCEQITRDEPRVARHLCWGFHVICEQGFPVDQKIFISIATGLLQITTDESGSAKELKLSSYAYNALAILIKKSDPQHVGSELESLTQEIVQRLSVALQKNSPSNPPNSGGSSINGSSGGNDCEIEGNLCICLSELLDKFPTDKILQNAALPKGVMELYIKCFDQNLAINDSIAQNTLLAVSMIIKKLGIEFEPYMAVFSKYLLMALKNVDDVQTCNTATQTVGNPVAEKLGEKFRTYADTLITAIVDNIFNQDVDSRIKLSCISCLGDVALAMRGEFVPALPRVIGVLQIGAEVRVDDEKDLEMLEHVCRLRCAILETYISIMYGLSDGREIQTFKAYCNQVVQLIQLIVEDFKRIPMLQKAVVAGGAANQVVNGGDSTNGGNNSVPVSLQELSKECIKNSCASLADMVQFYRAEFVMFLKDAPFLQELHQLAQASSDAGIAETIQLLQKLLQAYS